MVNLDAEKLVAARRAVEFVEDGQVVGLGTGSTAAHAIREIGRRVREGLQIVAIPTSLATEALARSLGIPLTNFDEHQKIDIAIDGADEIDSNLVAIKGGGGAFLREKIVAQAATRMICIIDSSKLVPQIGAAKLPIEVLPFAAGFVQAAVAAMGAQVSLRRKADGSLFATDQGNAVLDARFGLLSNPEALARKLTSIPGLLAHGLFLSEIDELITGRGDQAECLRRSA
ncbi:ribose-5-phosphate isomerase RpiA [Bryobacter aggregatus]|uniref:ribose-5-phosphate isomerase RpiA n=1 Tax=Bryobacter aggregatus TaxID=360054 RepID=UPI0004E19A5B|nr:ribose-5-phosphate isomerase RpiA [Bryobacter aggregatus]